MKCIESIPDAEIKLSIGIVRSKRCGTPLSPCVAVVFNYANLDCTTRTDTVQCMLPMISSKEIFLGVQNKVCFDLRILFQHFFELDSVELGGAYLPAEREGALDVLFLSSLHHIGRHV